MMSCRSLKSLPDHYWLRADLQEKCFEGRHPMWTATFGFLGAFWALGLPTSSTWLLWRRKAELHVRVCCDMPWRAVAYRGVPCLGVPWHGVPCHAVPCRGANACVRACVRA